MSNIFISLLTGKCTIQKYTKDSTTKVPQETWTPVDKQHICRKMTSESSLFSPEKGLQSRRTTYRFAMKSNAPIATKDRIVYGGETFEIIDVLSAGGYSEHHKIAKCEKVQS